jgi:hypothetical protein
MKNSNQPNFTKEMVSVARSTILIFIALIILHGCEETNYTPRHSKEITTSGRRPGNPSPAPLFYFTNCGNPVSAFTGNFVAGTPTTATVTLTYINSPGGSYPMFTSNAINGITLSAPAGTLSVGSGSITFTASGTPVSAGSISIPVSIGESISCNLAVTILNAPSSGNCSEPGSSVGSTGCVTFTYRGNTVNYFTVRAADGKVWLQQNLGSPQVAVNRNDAASFGHFFQWGRWDDGHQVANSTTVTGSTALQNPSHIPSGNPNFIKGSTTATAWWATGGNANDTWSGTNATAANGKDPCTNIGSGWHLPSAAEWINVRDAEFISDAVSAFDSHLKLTESGYRASANAALTPTYVDFGHYWSSTAAGNTSANVFYFDGAYNAHMYAAERGYGFNCRCVKD